MSNNAQPDLDARSLLLTRSRESAERFVAELDPAVLAGVVVVLSPLLTIVPTGNRPDLSNVGSVIFTSANGVDLAPTGSGKPAFCVGEKTAALARDRGWDVALVAPTAEALLEKIGTPPQPVIHLSGQHRRGDIVETLSARGITAEASVLYDQQLAPLSQEALRLLEGPTEVIAPLFSPRTAQAFLRDAPDLTRVTVIALSEAVADIFAESPAKEMITCKAPTAEEMVRAVEMRLRRTTLP